MPTPLTITLCLTLALAITAGAFYWGYKIGIICKVADDVQIRINLAVKQIEAQDEVIEQLNYQLDNNNRERTADRPVKTGWDPGDPLSSHERR